MENRFLFDVDKATKALANSGYVMIVKNDVLEPISGNQDLPTLFTTGRIFLILYYRDVDGAGSVRLGGGGPAPGGGVPREHEFHDATLCPRHVAQNVRENNLLRPIVTRPDGLTDRDPAGGKFPKGPPCSEKYQRRIPKNKNPDQCISDLPFRGPDWSSLRWVGDLPIQIIQLSI